MHCVGRTANISVARISWVGQPNSEVINQTPIPTVIRRLPNQNSDRIPQSTDLNSSDTQSQGRIESTGVIDDGTVTLQELEGGSQVDPWRAEQVAWFSENSKLKLCLERVTLLIHDRYKKYRHAE